MDPQNRSNNGHDQYSPARPTSMDGFLPPVSQPGAAPAQPMPSALPAAPSQTRRPFQPASFYQPPEPPKLPKFDPSPVPPARRPSAPKHSSGLRDLLSIGGVLASALLLAFLLINFVFQSYQVEGPSMKQTLQNRDHLIVWKVDKTLAKLTGNDYIPQRGDIVIFNDPVGDTSGAAGKQLIKRVVALPGERIVMKGTSMTVFNAERPEGFSPDTDMPYGKLIINEKSSNADYTIGKHQVFVAGDNRDNSHDSRAFGPLEVENIVGRLAVRILPLNTFKTF